MKTDNLSYGLTRLLLRLPALLPLSVLYILADLLYIIIYIIIGYRRKIVSDNLEKCFPDASATERKDIERKFYRNFADYIVETVKLLHISDNEMCRRMEFENVELIDRLTSEGRDVVVLFAHTGNWEWTPSITLHASDDPRISYLVTAQTPR